MAKNRKKGSIIRNLILIIALAVFIFSACQLIFIYLEYKKGSDEYAGLADEAEKIMEQAKKEQPEKETEVSGGGAGDETGPWTTFYNSMKQENEDYIGWIIVEDTNINYPIVQCGDNDYYLSHTFERAENAAGTLFVDYQIAEGMDARNVIVYGHNMKNGSMFANLKKYREEEFYENHKTFQVYTESGFYTYEVFSVYITSPDSDTYTIGLADNTDFMNYIEKMQAQSIYSTGVTVNENDKIITLSTCVNKNVDRLIVQARRLDS